MTISDPKRDAPGTPDASDVVTGPIGSARLRDLMSTGPEGVDRDRLPAIDVVTDDQQRSEETGQITAGPAGGSPGAPAEPSVGGQAPRAVEAGLPARS